MANYFEMNRDELVAEQEKLKEQYKKFQDMHLKLNMARGKPGPHQMDLAMGLLQMTDYTTDAGTDARNYGDLEGLHEARVLFADIFGVKPEEVFVGGNSSLQLDVQPHQYRLCVRLPGVSLPVVSGGEAQVPLPGARL